MANRIIIATLYQSASDSLYFLNISPDNITLNAGDTLYLIVESGNVGTSPSSFTFGLNYAGDGPFVTQPSVTTGSFAEPINLGTIADNYGNSYSYTLSVIHNGLTYSEDPKMKINPQG